MVVTRHPQSSQKRTKAQAEEILRKAFNASSESITISRLRDGRFIDVNEQFETATGLKREDVVGRTSIELGLWKNSGDRSRLEESLKRDGMVKDFETDFIVADGEVLHCSLSAEILDIGGERCMLATVRDITDARRSREALAWFDERLQSERRTLIEKEAALKQVLDHMEQEKATFRTEVVSHVTDLLEPIITKLRQREGRLPHKDVDRLEQSLKRIVDADVYERQDNFNRLTPREIEICDAIRRGLSSKEIADEFSLSVNTVHKHRQVIRRKLQLNNKEINLAAYLRSR